MTTSSFKRSRKIRVVVADDHHIFRQGLVRLIEDHPSFSVVGETGEGDEAWNMIVEKKPDIAVIDLAMPGYSGLEIATNVRNHGLKVELVVLTSSEDQEPFNEAVNRGIKGYLIKENTFEDLIKALEAVSGGKSYISPYVSDFLLVKEKKKKEILDKVPEISSLTATETMILRHISEKKTSRKIAEELFVSVRTVQKHRVNICRKLNLRGMNALLTFIVENKDKI